QQPPSTQAQYGMSGSGSNPYVDPYSGPQRSLSPSQQQPAQQSTQYHDQPYSTQQQQEFLYTSGNVQSTGVPPGGHVPAPWNHPGNTLVNSGNVGIGTTPTPSNNYYGGGGGHGMPGGYPSETTSGGTATPPVPPPKHQTSVGSIPSDAPPGYDGGYAVGGSSGAPASSGYPAEKR
ncbi:hypothetical protein FRC17_006352, partial [Serendipita sp. 399]